MNSYIDIKSPKRLQENTLRVVPLGGLGEVGRNMSTIEYIDPIGLGDPKILILDCGVLFPGDDEPGVDLILPDFSYISDRLDKVEALCLTHGHEDHIGAVPFLLKLRPDIPLVGSKLTIELVKSKLMEHKINPVTYIVGEGDELRFGPFLLNFLPVNHSIPDALGVFMKTTAGNILDTGDFKMDQRPLDGRLTDLRAFTDAGREGIDLFMVDSTNALNPGFVTSEAEIGPAIDAIFARHTEGVIFASTFASHIHRVQHIFNAALRHGRKVALVGRSMVKNMDIAIELGLLKVPRNVIIDLKDAPSLDPKKLVIMCTGSQGEQNAALSRMIRGDHPTITIKPNDTVILASSQIPGNEKSITAILNGLLLLGANVYNSNNAKVHCSGHANEGELRYIYNVVKPKNVLPIHGEIRHLVANSKIAQSTGLNASQTPVILSGGVVDVRDGKAEIVGKLENGYIFVDGKQVGSIDEEGLKHRRILSEEGFVAVFVTVDVDARKVISRPKIIAKGVAEDDSVFYRLPHKVSNSINRAMQEDDITNIGKLTQIVRRTVGRWVAKELRRAPMILPMVQTGQETLS